MMKGSDKYKHLRQGLALKRWSLNRSCCLFHTLTCTLSPKAQLYFLSSICPSPQTPRKRSYVSFGGKSNNEFSNMTLQLLSYKVLLSYLSSTEKALNYRPYTIGEYKLQYNHLSQRFIYDYTIFPFNFHILSWVPHMSKQFSFLFTS